MKTAIIYYSFSGNTRRIAEALKEKLALRDEVDMLPLEVINEEKRFLVQAKQAFLRQAVNLKNINFDLSSYGLICIGSPVWAFEPVPAVRTYLKKARGLAGKKTVVFLTFGSGLGVNKCLKNLVGILAKKGSLETRTLTYPQSMIKARPEIAKRLESLVKDL